MILVYVFNDDHIEELVEPSWKIFDFLLGNTSLCVHVIPLLK